MKYTVCVAGILIAVSFGGTVLAEPQPAAVSACSIVTQGSYYESVLRMLDDATESVFVVMPSITFAPKERNARSTMLLQALVRAHRRGVFVFVLLNLNDARAKAPENIDAFFFLNDNGIAVHFDNIPSHLRAASVVVDREVSLVGSSIWTEESLASTFNVDMKIDSKDSAEEIISFATSVPVYDNPLALEYYNQLYLFPEIVHHPNGIKAFHERNDHEAFMLYLYLLRLYAQDGQPEWITVEADALAEELSFLKKERREAARHHVRLLLERLNNTYVLIGFDQISEDFSFRVTFYDLAEGGKLVLPFLDGIRISDAFFEAGWFTRLSIAEMHMYFFLLELESKVGYQSWFDVPYDEMKLIPGLRDDQALGAIRALREHNLIQVHYKDIPKLVDVTFSDFECLMRTPYFEEWFEKELRDLTKRYSSRFVSQASAIAREMLLGKDIVSIERIVQLIETYSHLRVNEVFLEQIKPLYPENAYRTIDYFEEKLQEAHSKKDVSGE